MPGDNDSKPVGTDGGEHTREEAEKIVVEYGRQHGFNTLEAATETDSEANTDPSERVQAAIDVLGRNRALVTAADADGIDATRDLSEVSLDIDPIEISIDDPPDQQPTPPSSTPPGLVDALTELSGEQLRDIAQWAGELALYREREQQRQLVTEGPGHGWDEDELRETVEEERPDDVPSHVSGTIHVGGPDQRYLYAAYNWADGRKEEYLGPRFPSD